MCFYCIYLGCKGRSWGTTPTRKEAAQHKSTFNNLQSLPSATQGRSQLHYVCKTFEELINFFFKNQFCYILLVTHHHLPHTWEVLYIKLYPLNTARLLSVVLLANTVRRKEKNMGTAAFTQQNLSTFNMHRYRCSLICLTKCSQVKTIFQLFILFVKCLRVINTLKHTHIT